MQLQSTFYNVHTLKKVDKSRQMLAISDTKSEAAMHVSPALFIWLSGEKGLIKVIYRLF